MAAAAIIRPLWAHTPGNKARSNQLTSYATGLHRENEKKIFIASNITNNARRVDVNERRRRCSNAAMDAMQPTGQYCRFRRHVTAPNDIFDKGWRGGGGWGFRRSNLSATDGGVGDTGVVTTQQCLPVRHVITLTKSMVHI
jgi:hypothetical protein